MSLVIHGFSFFRYMAAKYFRYGEDECSVGVLVYLLPFELFSWLQMRFRAPARPTRIRWQIPLYKQSLRRAAKLLILMPWSVEAKDVDCIHRLHSLGQAISLTEQWIIQSLRHSVPFMPFHNLFVLFRPLPIALSACLSSAVLSIGVKRSKISSKCV